MKKSLLFIGILIVSLISCGEKEEGKKEATPCSCKKLIEQMDKETASGKTHKEVMNAHAKEFRNCDKIQDEMGLDKFREEMDKCK